MEQFPQTFDVLLGQGAHDRGLARKVFIDRPDGDPGGLGQFGQIQVDPALLRDHPLGVGQELLNGFARPTLDRYAARMGRIRRIERVWFRFHACNHARHPGRPGNYFMRRAHFLLDKSEPSSLFVARK